MRSCAVLMAALLIAACTFAGPAMAQAWMEYHYPDYAFIVMLPAPPKVETSTYEPVDGRSVPARIWSVNTGGAQLKITVADIANTGLQENVIIDHVMKSLSQGGEVKSDPSRINRVYGREFSSLNRDGSRIKAAVFDYNDRVYLIEAKLRPGGDDTDIIRFQQSLIFTDGGSNRSDETIRAIRAACPGRVAPGGFDDPNCPKK